MNCVHDAEKILARWWTMCVTRTYFTKEQKDAGVGSLLDKSWVLLKVSLFSIWGVLPGHFHLDYSDTHVRNLTHQFELKTTQAR